jgi:alpha-beta hydrolase superfamily lysophospholipase
MSDLFFTLSLAAIGRILVLRDRSNGSYAKACTVSYREDERLTIQSGDRTLDATFVSAGEGAPAALICHGIGEVVEYWGAIQRLLQVLGISSLVFDYSGYGRSTGLPSAENCEEDAIVALEELSRRANAPLFLLGFSLGTGISASIARCVPIAGLILCEGYSSLREAAASVGVSPWLASEVPDTWQTERLVAELSIPVLVMHSDADDLFPVSMAKRVAAACNGRGQLIVLPGLTHNQPIFIPTKDYWGRVADWIFQHSAENQQRPPANMLHEAGAGSRDSLKPIG